MTTIDATAIRQRAGTCSINDMIGSQQDALALLKLVEELQAELVSKDDQIKQLLGVQQEQERNG